MTRRAATKTFSLTAIAAMIAAPVVVATAAPASAAARTAITTCTSATVQAAITAGGSYDLAACSGKTITSVVTNGSSSALVDNGKTVSLSYTGTGKAPVLKFASYTAKASLLDIESGSVTLTGLSLSGISLSTDPTQPTLGGAFYVASGATLNLQKDFVSSSAAVGGVGVKGTDGTTAGAAGGNGSANAADGLGGAIYNAGTTNIIGSLFSTDSAVGGAGVNGGSGMAGTTGPDGPASTTAGTAGSDGTAGGNGGGGGDGTNGGAGQGGAIYNSAGGVLNINSTEFAADNAVGGKGGNGGNAANGGNGGAGGAGADATASAGAGSAGGNGGAGGTAGAAGSAGTAGAGEGGAIYNAGTAHINAATVFENTAKGGAGGAGGNAADGGNGGGGGVGGNGADNTTTGGTLGAAGGAGGAGGNGGAAGASNGDAAAGTNGGLAEGAGIVDTSTSQIASTTFDKDTATGGAGGSGGNAGNSNSATGAVGGKGGTGGSGQAGSITGGTGGGGGKGGNGANGGTPAKGGNGATGGAAQGLMLFTTGGTSVGCNTNDDVVTDLAGGAAGAAGTAGTATPQATAGTGSAGGAGGTGGVTAGGAGATGGNGSAGTSGGGAAAAGTAGSAGASDGNLTDGSLANQACATFTPTGVSFKGNVGTTGTATIKVTNNGSVTFTVSGVTVSNDPNGDLGTPTNGCTSVSPGSSCTITLAVTPHTAGGTDSVTVNIQDNGVGGTQSVPVSVTGNQDASKLANAVSQKKIVDGHAIIISTTVGDGVTFAPIGGAKVELLEEAANANAYTVKGTATTNSSGKASLPVTPDHNTSYKWAYLGSGVHGPGASPVTKVTVVRTVQIALAHPSIKAGSTAVAYGTTSPADVGVSCTLQQKSKSTWVKASGPVKTKKQKLPNGKTEVGYSLSAHTRSGSAGRGTYLLRVVCAANSLNAAGTSATESLLAS